MIKKHLQILRPAILIGIGLAFAFIGAAVDSIASSTDPSAAALYQAISITPTATVKAVSQVGSTDQIVLMGFVIVGIILLPVIFRRNTWTNK